MSRLDRAGVAGLLRVKVSTPDPDAIILGGMDNNRVSWSWDEDRQVWVSSEAKRTNAYVNQGLQRMLDKFFSTGTAPSHIGVSSDNAAVTAATTAFGGTERFAAFNGGTPSRTGQTTTVGTDFTKGAGAGQIDFSVRKIGISAGSTTGNVMDVIGGAGSSPYNEPLTIDLTGASSFTLRLEIDTTLTAL